MNKKLVTLNYSENFYGEKKNKTHFAVFADCYSVNLYMVCNSYN